MLKAFKKLYTKNSFSKFLLAIPKLVYDLYRYKILSDTQFLKSRFKFTFGKELNLENPRTFNEKIQWLKINDRRAIYTICADKHAVRDYIANKIGQEILIPMILVTNKSEEINPENLPDYPIIIKSTHASGRYIIIRDKNQIIWPHLRKTLKKWLKENYYLKLREWQYKDIPHALIVEKLLTDKNGKIPSDVKFHCFNGEIEFIEVHENRLSAHKKIHYDENWNVLKFKSYFEEGNPSEPPVTFNKMKEIARILSKEFYYVRVDLYELNAQVYFGELTFHPGSGFKAYEPEEQDLILGNKLRLPINKII
jgi:hypothetical protein